jgi:molybdopterin-guanine dinucleotide biosynthesis protein A
VHWLRVLREALRDGAAELVKTTPAGRISVCESNSLRHVVEPGLFLQVRLEGQERFKASARRVADLADRVVVSDGAGFDVPLEKISVVDGQWALRREATAVVVTPSEASPSSSLPSIVDVLRPHVSQTRIVSAAPRTSKLRALVDALADAASEWTLVSFDAAALAPAGVVNALFRRSGDVDGVVATRDGSPIVGVYRRRVAERASAALHAGASSHTALAEHATIREIELPGTEDGFAESPQNAPK